MQATVSRRHALAAAAIGLTPTALANELPAAKLNGTTDPAIAAIAQCRAQ